MNFFLTPIKFNGFLFKIFQIYSNLFQFVPVCSSLFQFCKKAVVVKNKNGLVPLRPSSEAKNDRPCYNVTFFGFNVFDVFSRIFTYFDVFLFYMNLDYLD